YGAKSVFDSKKLYFFSIGLFDDIVRRMADRSEDNRMDAVDGIFTADEFTKELMCKALAIPEEKVIVTGSPLLERVADREEGARLREAGRSALGIAPGAVVAFHSSIVPSAFEKV